MLNEEFVGKKVRKISGKPFKSTLRWNTVKAIVEHPVTKVPSFLLEEDDTIVEATKCTTKSDKSSPITVVLNDIMSTASNKDNRKISRTLQQLAVDIKFLQLGLPYKIKHLLFGDWKKRINNELIFDDPSIKTFLLNCVKTKIFHE